ncbi:MAG: DsrE/DsrF/DrsH-like family protein [Thermodesulfobacteriota bacterium]
MTPPDEPTPPSSVTSGNLTLTPEMEAFLAEQVQLRVAEELKRQGLDPARPKRVALIASKGTMDLAYPPLLLATTAAALEMEAAVFFTLYGLNIVKKKTSKRLRVPSLGNPALPVPVPNIIGVLPGMTRLATWMMRDWMKKGGLPNIPDLLLMAQENGVRLIVCQMSLEVLGVRREEMLGGLEYADAATFLNYAAYADVTLFV